MEGTLARAAAAAALLAASFAGAGCCGLTRARDIGNRDTPEAAFEFVRSAFAEDRTGNELDALHQDFQGRQGINRTRYLMARSLRPGLFEKAARILGGARLDSVQYARIPTGQGPGEKPRTRDAARVTLSTPGGSGVFILVDEPTWTVVTWDPENGAVPLSGHVADMAGMIRIQDGQVVVDVHRPLDYPPEGSVKILRFEIHHDWLLFDIESLDGFREFLGEVEKTAESAPAAPAKKEGAPQ